MSKLNLQDVARIVENEGLGYAVQHYMNGDSIENEYLSDLWIACKALLDEIDSILESYFED